MKIFLKFVLLISLITLAIGCPQDINNKKITLDVKKGVDIWNSINYEIISDANTVKEFDSSSKGTVLISFTIRIENKGKERAESFVVNLIEPKPYKYVDASSNKGIGHGYLNTNKGYQMKGYYIFSNLSDAEDFIENSDVTINWIEEKKNKEINLKLPSKPTQ